MTDLAPLIAARDALDAIINAAQTPADGGTADPLTSPLTAEGAWVPPYLGALIRATKAKYPDGYGAEDYDFASGKRIRKPISYPRAFVLQSILQRADLTEPQRNLIQDCNRFAFMGGLSDSGEKLNHFAIERVLTGGYLSVAAVVYDANLDRLERDTRRLFAEFGVEV